MSSVLVVETAYTKSRYNRQEGGNLNVRELPNWEI